MMPDRSPTIDPIRDASRRLVRELGFLRPTLAGTDLPASAVHALIEIGGEQGITAAILGQRLVLEKSSVSRMLAKLIAAGLIASLRGAGDGRTRPLMLTQRGQEVVAAIHGFGRTQVANALAQLTESDGRTVLAGISLYAGALAKARLAGAPPPPAIETGYHPGLMAQCLALHMDYYARATGFGLGFEAKVAAGLAEFAPRMERPGNRFWHARLGGRMVATIAIDGEDLGNGLAHLRWFIVDETAQGGGLGRRLLAEAIAFCKDQGFAAIQLWTFQGLDRARHLYESQGFTLTEQYSGDQWGKPVMEQRFNLDLSA
jgi:DNA-binding MarR family transcriptional regulator/GNAT superfamily N-acetyltransferase